MVEIADIKRLAVSSGDTVVVRVRGRLSRDVAASIRSQVQSALPDGVRAMVVDDGVVDITVLAREQTPMVMGEQPTDSFVPLSRVTNGSLGVKSPLSPALAEMMEQVRRERQEARDRRAARERVDAVATKHVPPPA